MLAGPPPERDECDTAATFRVLRADLPAERREWLALWESWPGREVAAHPAYAELFVGDEGATPLAACVMTEAGAVLYPLLKRPLSRETSGWFPSELAACCDLVSPYGYGGPFCWGADADSLAERFWPRFEAWCTTQGVVTEFVRFSLFEDSQLAFPGVTEERLTNVVCRLDRTREEISSGFRSKVRRNVAKARREGVEVVRDETGESMAEFCRVYELTMQRRNADGRYYFGERFFDRLVETLPGQFVLFHAVHEGRVISTELVLESEQSVFFFLGGTDADYYALRPNELLKTEVIWWAHDAGKTNYVLGGGYEEQDGVFRFKEAFDPGGLRPFRIGKRVHDESVYQRLNAARARDGAAAAEGFFPRYRAA